MTRPQLLNRVRALESFSPRSHVMLLAYYLRRSAQPDFTQPDLEQAYRTAEVPVPPSASLGPLLQELSTGRSAPLVVVEGSRYSLSAGGLEEVETLLRQLGGLQAAIESIDELVGSISPESDDRFLPEVRQCIHAEARRAVVVMMWLLTVDHLERYILAHKLTEFNTAMRFRSEYSTTAPLSSLDDFDELRKELHLLDIMASARIITSDMKRLLGEKLEFRNTCAHPNAIVVSDAKLVSYVEDLVHNVILRLKL